MTTLAPTPLHDSTLHFQAPWLKPFAALAWLGLVLQLPLTVSGEMDKGHSLWWGVMMFFGYFTIISNLVCALVLTAHAAPRWQGTWGRALRSHWLAASATVAIAITFLVFNLVLRATSTAQGYRLFVDTILHVLTPLAMVFFWWRATPRGSLHWGMLPLIAAYPLVYLVYYFVRGALIDHYPYFFMNVTTLGYAVSLRNAGAVVLVFSCIACGMVASKRTRVQVGP